MSNINIKVSAMEYMSVVDAYWQIEKAIEKNKQKSNQILITSKNSKS